jgi:hypothetical protein
MRDARRGDYLRFEPDIFAEEREPATRPLPRHSSREAEKAWRAFLKNAAGHDPSSVSMPVDAIVDEAFRTAVARLDAEDSIQRPLDARVDVRPDDLA